MTQVINFCSTSARYQLGLAIAHAALVFTCLATIVHLREAWARRRRQVETQDRLSGGAWTTYKLERPMEVN